MFISELFKNYVFSNTTPEIRDEAKHVDVERLIIGKLGITAIAKDSTENKVNIVLFEGKIHSSSCTCPEAKEGVCRHVVAVLKAADNLLIQQTGTHPSLEKNEIHPAHPSIYSFLNFNFSDLTNTFIFEHVGSNSSGTFRTCYIDKIDYNTAQLTVSRNFYERFPVSLTYNNDDLILECQCNKQKRYLCEHQELVLFQLKDNASIRLFFDKDYRLKYLQGKVADYGLQKESNLDDFFKIKLAYNNIVIEPQIKGLISMGENAFKKMESSLKLKKAVPAEFHVEQKETGDSFIVFGQHKRDDDFFINVMTSGRTKEGKIKNPIRVEDANLLMLQTDEAQVMKFYLALSQFQDVDYRYSMNRNQDIEITGLRSIVKNPLGLEIYCLNVKKSENITSSSIEPVNLRKVEVDLHFKIVQKENFYEITPKLFMDGSVLSYSKIKLVYKYFLRTEKELLFIPDPDILRVLAYLKAHNNKLLIHQSKFEEFRETILANLESKINIDYSFLKPASEKQLVDFGFNEEPKKVVYLAESEDFILITPAMRYGNVEVPVRSKKRIYGLDALSEHFEVQRDEAEEIRMLFSIQRQHPDFQEQEAFEYFYLHKKQFLDSGWFLDAFENWKQENIEILGFNELNKNNYSPSKMKVSLSVASGIDWFDTAVKISFGKEEARLKEIQRAIHNQSRFVKLGDGQIGMMPQDWIDKFSEFFRTGDVVNNQIRTSKMNFSIIDELFEDEILSTEVIDEIKMYREHLLGFEEIKEINIPKKLKAELRDYQKHGLNWLHFLDEFNFGGCLADDMGLGKTIQILAFILSLKEKNGKRTHLIVLPTSLLFNWKIELEKFAPSLKFHTIYGIDRKKDLEGLEKYDIIFTTYGTLLSDITFLTDFQFDYVFLDESQAIKNPESKRYKSVRLLKSRNKVVLTGTPVENNTFDLYAQFSFVSPGLLGNQQRFKDNYAVPIDKFKDTKRARELQRKLNPFLLRRTKKQVAKELPDKTEMVIFCEMGKEQRKVYETYKNEFKLYLQKSDKEELHNKSMHILQGLTKLRQICNSPALLSDQEYYGSESAKIEELVEQIEMKSSQHKILIFSQFVKMLDLIKLKLDEKSVKYEYLTGQTRNRAEKVNQFQTDEETRVFLISLKAGGTGLNLTEADYVFIVDPWWNPAVENQAIDRCYRIGQKKNVMAVRLISPDTIEEKIMLLQETKKELIDDLIKADSNAMKSLSKDDVLELIS